MEFLTLAYCQTDIFSIFKNSFPLTTNVYNSHTLAMKNTRLHILYCILLFIGHTMQAQLLVDYTNPSGSEVLQVCEQATFAIQLSNNGSDAIDQISITQSFPSGVSYVPGSVAGADESDISDLQNPVFTFSNLAGGQTATINLEASAACELVDRINAGNLFSNTINVSYDGNNNTISTDNYDIETPLIVIVSATNQLVSGRKGQTITRTFTIQNTRFGKLAAFEFRDRFPTGLIVTTTDGTDISTQANEYIALFDGNDFRSIGNGDEFFDQDEVIVITERVLIDDCGVSSPKLISQIDLSWGCNMEVCETTIPFEAVVEVLPSTLSPDLVFRETSTAPECYCPFAETTQELEFTNRGNEPAENIEITIEQLIFNSGFPLGAFTVDSAGVILNVNPTYGDKSSSCTPDSDTLYRSIFFQFPTLAVGQTITISWTAQQCRTECNSSFTNEWQYQVDYERSCPPEKIIEVPYKVISQSNGELSALLEVLNSGDDNRTFQYTLNEGGLLDTTNNTLTLTFEFTCLVGWEQDNELILGGNTPISIDEMVDTNGIRIITATYQLPFAQTDLTTEFDLVLDCETECEFAGCIPAFNTTCRDTCPDPRSFVVTSKASFTLSDNCADTCGITICESIRTPFPCEIPGCVTDIPGYFSFEFNVFRVNTGLADNDDDNFPDPGGNINLNQIRRDRYIPGDTLRTTFAGEVVIDIPGNTFEEAVADVQIAPGFNGTSWSYQEIIDGFTVLQNELVIVDNSSGIEYTCDEVPVELFRQMSLTPQLDTIIGNFTFSVNLGRTALQNAGCGIPADFVWDDGDSIYIQTDYRLNLIPDVTKDTAGLISLNAIPEIYQANQDIMPLDRQNLFTCSCYNNNISLSEYIYEISTGLYPIPPCDTSEYISGQFFRMELAFGNFFPFEYRPLAKITDWSMELPPGFEISESRLLFVQLQDQRNLVNDQSLTNMNVGNTWRPNLLDFLDENLEEGYTILVQHRFKATDCSLTGVFPLTVNTELEFSENLPESNPIDLSFTNTNGLRMLVPKLEADVLVANNTSFDDLGRWQFRLFYRETQIASSKSGPLYNVYIVPSSQSGRVTDFQLTNVNTGQVYPLNNGVFQIGDLVQLDTLTFQLTGLNGSCLQESVELRYGWNCTPVGSSIETTCNSSTFPLTVISPPAELEQVVTGPTGSFALCDTIDYYTIEFFNADLGRAKSVIIEAQLPPGLSILPGSSQLAYPVTDGFMDIADPVLGAGNIARWEMNTVSDSLRINGLPGSNQAPLNVAQIRFQLISNCDFIVGSQPVFVAKANLNCDQPANTLAEAGVPIDISSVSSPYSTNLGITPNGDINCDDEIDLQINMSADQMTSFDDSIIITLPVGISYVTGSYLEINNAPSEDPTISGTTRQLLSWKLPTGIPAGSGISFNIRVSGLSNLDCGQQLFLIQTTAPENALCQESGVSCSVQVQTGSSIFGLPIERPILDPISFNVTANTNNGNDADLSYEVEVFNSGAGVDRPVIVDIYFDADGDGELSTGDQLLDSGQVGQTPDNNETVIVNGFFTLSDLSQLCQLIAVIDPEKHCACQTGSIPVNNPINVNYTEKNIVCSGEIATLGIDSLSGNLYEWNPDDHLACNNCPTTNFEFENQTGSIASFIYTLSQLNDDGCQINNQINVEVRPEPAILNADSAACAGTIVELMASAGQSYQWSGPGITDPSLQNQIITLNGDGLYIVSITDDAGCDGIDSFQVNVLENPIAEAGTDTTLCENSAFQLGEDNNPDYTYSWSPANAVDDPTASNPTITNTTINQFFVTVTNTFGCQSSDSIEINFSEAPLLTATQADPVCAGQEVEITVSGASTYSWSPGRFLNCTDCPTVTARPDSSTTYTVTGTNTFGCENTLTIPVIVNPPFDLSEPLEICEGETVDLFEQAIGEAGTYCEDYITSAGCDSTQCFVLTVNEVPDLVYNETIEGFRGTDVPVDLPPGFDYSWSPDEYLSCNDCASTIISIPGDETRDELLYDIEVLNDEGCGAMASLRVLLNDAICEEPFIFVPNAFTPNDDGENDFFQVYGAAIERLELIIVDRWGKTVFESQDPDVQWDGTLEGKKLFTQVFGYYLVVDCIGGERFVKKGNVTLVR